MGGKSININIIKYLVSIDDHYNFLQNLLENLKMDKTASGIYLLMRFFAWLRPASGRES